MPISTNQKKWLFIAGGVVVMALIIWGSTRDRGGGSGKAVYAEAASLRDIVSKVTASGEISPILDVEISAKTVGQIERRYISSGDMVKRGQVLMELDKRKILQDIRRLEASLNSARIQVRTDVKILENSEASLARNEQLAKKGFVADDALDKFRLERDTSFEKLNASRARVVEVQATLDRSNEDLRDMTYVSPIDGMITRVYMEMGETVVPGTTNQTGSVLCVVSDMSRMTAQIKVDETDIVDIMIGQPVEVVADALPEVKLPGEVRQIGTSAGATSDGRRAFAVEVMLDDPDPRLRPGMNCDADIETGRKDAVLAVPISALVTLDDEKAVFIIGKDNKAEKRTITTGLSDDTHIEVLEGLDVDDNIITGPYRTLKKLEGGEKVKIKKLDHGDGDEEEEDDE